MIIASDDEQADELQLQAELKRLEAENFQLRQDAQKHLARAELAEEERDALIADMEIMREKYARRCR